MYEKDLIVSLIDLTSLNENDDDTVITALCEKAMGWKAEVATVCIYPKFVALAKRLLSDTNIKVVTVVNFPSGNEDFSKVLLETKMALADGADEIDVVIPYKEYIENNKSENAKNIVSECKKLCGDKLLKVIIESGELKTSALIEMASIDAIESGADFIKTSTGKVSIGATLEAADAMLGVINKYKNNKLGFKASGGIRDYSGACDYLSLAEKKCGNYILNKKTFRFGASGLFDNLTLKTQQNKNNY